MGYAEMILIITGIILTILGSIAGWIYFFGKLVRRQEEQKEAIAENELKLGLFHKDLDEKEEKLNLQHRSALYHKDGTTVYTPREEFIMAQEKSQQDLLNKIEKVEKTMFSFRTEIKTDLKEVKDEIKDEKEKRTEQMIEISGFMGGIEQAFKDVKGELLRINGKS